MSIPELTLRSAQELLKAFCDNRVPALMRSEIQLETRVHDNHITLVERRPPWDDPDGSWTERPIARFDYKGDSGLWQLKACDQSQQWQDYAPLPATRAFDKLLAVLGKDTSDVFWG